MLWKCVAPLARFRSFERFHASSIESGFRSRGGFMKISSRQRARILGGSRRDPAASYGSRSRAGAPARLATARRRRVAAMRFVAERGHRDTATPVWCVGNHSVSRDGAGNGSQRRNGAKWVFKRPRRAQSEFRFRALGPERTCQRGGDTTPVAGCNAVRTNTAIGACGARRSCGCS